METYHSINICCFWNFFDGPSPPLGPLSAKGCGTCRARRSRRVRSMINGGAWGSTTLSTLRPWAKPSAGRDGCGGQRQSRGPHRSRQRSSKRQSARSARHHDAARKPRQKHLTSDPWHLPWPSHAVPPPLRRRSAFHRSGVDGGRLVESSAQEKARGTAAQTRGTGPSASALQACRPRF